MTEVYSMHGTTPDTGKPLISVIIPAHNEERFIGNCISSVFQTHWPSKLLEVIVIDHQSTDETARIAQSLGARVLHQSLEKNIGAVRNTGLDAANGQFVAYVDADCTVTPDWLPSAIRILQSSDTVGAVGGPCLSPSTGTWVEKCLAPTKIGPQVIKHTITLATSSFITRTKLLRDLGHFDETLISGEDDDISNRIRRLGLSLISTSDCHIIHYGYPRTLWSMLKKEIWHGSNHIDVRSGFDLTLVLTFIFFLAATSALVLLPFVVLNPNRSILCALSVALALHFTPPLLYALKRLRQYPLDWLPTLLRLPIGYAYFVGHTIGVFVNLYRRATVADREYLRPLP